MKLVLEGSTLQELGEQAQAFLSELDGDSAAAATPPVATATRGRGRPRKADTAAAATSAAVETAASAPPPTAPIPGDLTKMTAAHAAASGVSKEAMLEAASKLIDAKGEAFAAALLDKNYKAVTFTGIPQARWGELIAEVNHILAQPKGLLG